MKKIFITGGTGFIGRRVIRDLRDIEDVEIFCLTRSHIDEADIKVHYLEADISNQKKITNYIKNIQPDTLLHLAWDVKGDNYSKGHHNLEWVSYSEKIADVFIESGGSSIVGAGTCAEYSNSKGEILTEESMTNPTTAYGKNKLKLFTCLSQKCASNNIRFVWGRPFFVYGAGEEDRKLISSVISTIKDGDIFVSSRPNDVVDYIHVDDVARAFSLFCINDDCSGVYNICTGVGYEVKEILHLVEKKLGKKGSVDISADYGNYHMVGSPEKLESVGWKASYSLEKGIESYI